MEQENKKNALTFFLVTGLLRMSNGASLWSLLNELSANKDIRFFITFIHFRNMLVHSVGCKFNQELVQWYDSDCGIFQSQRNANFGHWLDFYLTQNQYKEKFSFFTVHVGEKSPGLSEHIFFNLGFVF